MTTSPAENTGRDVVRYSTELIRTHDRDRYLLHLFAPTAKRPALASLFAFNVEIAKTREAVSEPMMGGIRLQWWREAIEELYAGRPRRHEIVLSLAEHLDKNAITRERLLSLIDARERDLDETPFATLEELQHYADATAGALHRAAADILGIAGESAERTAIGHASRAYALTGLLSAVPFHARGNRVFLPVDLLSAAGLRRDSLRPDRAAEGLANVVRQIAEAAAQDIAIARSLRRQVSSDALPLALSATLASRRLRQLGQAAFDPYRLPTATHEPGLPLRLAWKAWRNRY